MNLQDHDALMAKGYVPVPWMERGGGITYNATFYGLGKGRKDLNHITFIEPSVPTGVDAFFQYLADCGRGLFNVAWNASNNGVGFYLDHMVVPSGGETVPFHIPVSIEGLSRLQPIWMNSWRGAPEFGEETFAAFLTRMFKPSLDLLKLKMADVLAISLTRGLGFDCFNIVLREELMYHCAKPIKLSEDIAGATRGWSKNDLALNRIVLTDGVRDLKDFPAVWSNLEAHDTTLRSWLSSLDLLPTCKCKRCVALAAELSSGMIHDPPFTPPKEEPFPPRDALESDWNSQWLGLTAHTLGQIVLPRAGKVLVVALDNIAAAHCHDVATRYASRGENVCDDSWLNDIFRPFENLIRAFTRSVPKAFLPEIKRQSVHHRGVRERDNNAREHMQCTIYLEPHAVKPILLNMVPTDFCGLACPVAMGCAQVLPLMFLEVSNTLERRTPPSSESAHAEGREKRRKLKFAVTFKSDTPAGRAVAVVIAPPSAKSYVPVLPPKCEMEYIFPADDDESISLEVKSSIGAQVFISNLLSGTHTSSNGCKLYIEALAALKSLHQLTGRSDFLIPTLLAGDGYLEIRLCGYDSEFQVFKCCKYASLDTFSLKTIFSTCLSATGSSTSDSSSVFDFILACCRVGIIMATQLERMSCLNLECQALEDFAQLTSGLQQKKILVGLIHHEETD